MENGFRVASGLVLVAGSFEVGPHIGMVENLAVIDDPKLFVLVRHRLMPGREVDDAQATMSEICRPFGEVPIFIGSAMRDRIGHAPQHRFGRRYRLVADESGYPAHRPIFSFLQMRVEDGIGVEAGLGTMAISCRTASSKAIARPLNNGRMSLYATLKKVPETANIINAIRSQRAAIAVVFGSR